MLTRILLNQYLQELLQPQDFKDYCPNGLQIQGKNEIHKIITGVSANQAFINQAITANADAVLVHHGLFWQNESPEIVAYKHQRIKALLINDINLFGYHLPLDAHPQFGNNIQLAQLLNITHPRAIGNSLMWMGELNTTTSAFKQVITQQLGREPQIFGSNDYIKSIAFCTGGAQNYITRVLDLEVDAYLSGEVSEQTPALARENDMLYISAGHHATERYGVQALGKHLAAKFGIIHQFIDIPNIV